MARPKKVMLVAPPKAPERVQRKKPKKPSLLDEMKAGLEVSPFSVVVDGEYDGKTKVKRELPDGSESVEVVYDPEKAEASASSAAYQVNLGAVVKAAKRWSETSEDLVSDVNPRGLKWYAAYQEASDRPGVFELVIGLRSHMPEEWAEFVHAAGSRKRKAAEKAFEVEPQAEDEESESQVDEPDASEDEVDEETVAQ